MKLLNSVGVAQRVCVCGCVCLRRSDFEREYAKRNRQNEIESGPSDARALRLRLHQILSLSPFFTLRVHQIEQQSNGERSEKR